jgi:hypothetical protein
MRLLRRNQPEVVQCGVQCDSPGPTRREQLYADGVTGRIACVPYTTKATYRIAARFPSGDIKYTNPTHDLRRAIKDEREIMCDDTWMEQTMTRWEYCNPSDFVH